MDPLERRRPERAGRLGRRAIWWLAWYAALALLWLLYVDSLDHPEVLAGLAAAPLASLAAIGLRTHGGERFRLRLRWLRLALGVPVSVVRDSATLAAALWRRLARREQVRGAFRLVRLPAGGDDPTGAAWRAFTVMATSVSPNTYVVGIDQERGAALIHQLVPPPAQDARSAVVGADA